MSGETVVFLDASVLVAASGSPAGGSSIAITVIHDSREYRAATSTAVLDEALRNVERQLGAAATLRFVALLRALNPTIHDPTVGTIHDLPDSVAAKDHHVVAACIAAGATICLSLDRRHLLTDELRRWGDQHGLRFLTPGEFLAEERERDRGNA